MAEPLTPPDLPGARDGSGGEAPLAGPPAAGAPPAGRGPLLAAIATFLVDQDADTLQEIHESLGRELDAAGPEAMNALCERLASTGADWHYYPRAPLARRIHALLAERLLSQGSALTGIEHVTAIAGKPVVIFANHLSYSDANLFEILLQRAGGGELSDRLTVMAGPKVYSSLRRRFSSLCFGTIKTPQNSAVSSEEAVMSTRDVARAARRSIQTALEHLRTGDALLVFAEGTRSRSNGLQPLLAGVTRYLDCPGVQILPVGIVGTEALFPIGEDTFRPVRIVARVGPPIDAAALRERAGGNRRLMMDAVGLAIAAQLPPAYRGAYADDVTGLDAARRLVEPAAHGAASGGR